MTDNAPGWQTDPTGRHDHRYWDGSQWTEHVSDAGVATTDPYDGAAPSVEAPAEPEVTTVADAPEAADDTPAVAEPAAEPEPPVAVPDPDAPVPGGAEPTASAGWPVDPDAPVASASEPDPEPTVVAPSYSSPVPPVDDEPAAEDAPTLVDAPILDADAPTTVQPIAEDITESWPVAPSSADAPPPPVFTPPASADGEGGDGDGDGGGSKKKLLIGVGLLAVVAIIIGVIALGGGDDKKDLRSRIASEIREGGQSGLDQEEAECLADELIDDLGADRLKDVDFTANEPPEEIAEELNESFVAAIPTCDIDLSGSDDDDDDTTDDTEVGETTDTSLTPEQVAEFRDLLAEQYRSTLGLSDDQSNCLADTMADAIEAGELTEQDSFDQFFEYLDACDISVSDLGGTAG